MNPVNEITEIGSTQGTRLAELFTQGAAGIRRKSSHVSTVQFDEDEFHDAPVLNTGGKSEEEDEF